MTSKKCSKCRQTGERSEFNKHSKKPDGLQPYCKPCQRKVNRYKNYRETILKWQNKRRSDNRRKLFEFLMENPCRRCGESDPVVLEFDHIKPKQNRQKSISLLAGSNTSWKKVLEEIKKCQVLCANCHRRKTARQLGWYKSVNKSEHKPENKSAGQSQNKKPTSKT